jgi:hypothetical protein
MATFSYPTSVQLRGVEQVLVPRLTADDLLFQILPTENVDEAYVIWQQKDDWFGLQQIRGYNGQPPKVQPIGSKEYLYSPGVYGEYTQIDEKRLTERARRAQLGEPVNIDDMVTEAQNLLLQRRLDRIRYIGWTLLMTGTFSVAHPNGGVQHTDTFSLSTYDATTWATVATATPLADLRAVQLLGPAQGTAFNSRAMAIMNRTTANNLLANTNSADIGGKRTAGLANILSFNDVNMLLTGEDLPNIVIKDDGYKNDAGTFTRWIPNGKVLVVGQRPGDAPVGNYYFTRNAQNDDLGPGPYTMVEDTMNQNKPPREINVHDGHNGGPVIYFPGSLVIMDVS